MSEWIIEAMQLDRDLEEVVALEALCFTNPTTRNMFRWEAEKSDVAHAYVMRRASAPRCAISPAPRHIAYAPAPPAASPAPATPAAIPAEGAAPTSSAPLAPGSLVAYCSVWVIFDELHINTLAVHPDCRRQGLASILLTHVLGDAAARGADKVTLEVRRSNAAALRLYERFGFALGGVRPAYYRNPVEDALILWRAGLRSAAADPPGPPNSLA